MNYLSWNQKTLPEATEAEVNSLYNEGYVFTRLGKGIMSQTRSVRIDLSKFELSSENRRVLKKTDGLSIEDHHIPYAAYGWEIAKLAKDFYSVKFGGGLKSIMGAAKVKEILTDASKSNFNRLLVYSWNAEIIGYCISRVTSSFLHYSYPFYELDKSPRDMGLGMMIRAIEYAKNAGLKYVYLGSLQRPSDTYKLQFSGLEWFDGRAWQTDLERAKKELSA